MVCHCSDCQAFAQRFDASDRVFGNDTGTLLYQSRCARMRIEGGIENLRCLHLTAKPTLRWYASCCDTPMFNTYRNGRLPYVTTLVGNCDPTRRHELLGEPIGHLFLDDDPTAAEGLEKMSMNTLLRRFAVRMVKDILAGDRRRSALFDSRTLQPIVSPATNADLARA